MVERPCQTAVPFNRRRRTSPSCMRCLMPGRSVPATPCACPWMRYHSRCTRAHCMPSGFRCLFLGRRPGMLHLVYFPLELFARDVRLLRTVGRVIREGIDGRSISDGATVPGRVRIGPCGRASGKDEQRCGERRCGQGCEDALMHGLPFFVGCLNSLILQSRVV